MTLLSGGTEWWEFSSMNSLDIALYIKITQLGCFPALVQCWKFCFQGSAQCYVAAWMGEEFGGEWIRVYVWRGVRGRVDTCICVAESLCCSPETTTTLLISYTPIENKMFNFFLKVLFPGNFKGKGVGQDRGRGLRGTNIAMYKVNKLQGYIVQHREYSRYFIATLNGALN